MFAKALFGAEKAVQMGKHLKAVQNRPEMTKFLGQQVWNSPKPDPNVWIQSHPPKRCICVLDLWSSLYL